MNTKRIIDLFSYGFVARTSLLVLLADMPLWFMNCPSALHGGVSLEFEAAASFLILLIPELGDKT